MRPIHFTRRQIIGSAAYAGAALPLVLPRLCRAISPNEKLNLASVGVAGKGWEDVNAASGDGKLHNVVAICDVDHRSEGTPPDNLMPAQKLRPMGIGAAAQRFPTADRFADFRRMFDQMQGKIDAVTVSTPDHMHATIALTAMQLGKHVYVQKPLTQTVHEARIMQQVAARTGVVTQMGNQYHSNIGHRCLVEVIRSGVIGKITEAHAWVGKVYWPQNILRPTGTDPVPDGLDWDLWLGACTARPYKEGFYAPFNWRGWRDFGSGMGGDMGCHVLDPVIWSLELGPPRSVESLGPAAVSDETFPAWTKIRYTFAPTVHTADQPLPVTWYDGGQLPPLELARMPAGQNLPGSGSLYIGDKGVIVSNFTPTIPRLYPQEQFTDYVQTTLKHLYKSFEPLDHHRIWTDACRGLGKTNSGFDYAGPLTETVQLGNIANRFPEQLLAWDAAALKFTDEPRATAWVRREYRKGWKIEALI